MLLSWSPRLLQTIIVYGLNNYHINTIMCCGSGKRLINWLHKNQILTIKRKEYIVPVLTEDQENKITQVFDELVRKSNITMCAHNAFILAKCLELIGENDLAQEFRKLIPYSSIDKLKTNDNRWNRFTNPE